jgi:hypothetical protein
VSPRAAAGPGYSRSRGWPATTKASKYGSRRIPRCGSGGVAVSPARVHAGAPFSLSAELWAAYLDKWPPDPGYEHRRPALQLHKFLNNIRHFGPDRYVPRIEAVLDGYGWSRDPVAADCQRHAGAGWGMP